MILCAQERVLLTPPLSSDLILEHRVTRWEWVLPTSSRKTSLTPWLLFFPVSQVRLTSTK